MLSSHAQSWRVSLGSWLAVLTTISILDHSLSSCHGFVPVSRRSLHSRNSRMMMINNAGGIKNKKWILQASVAAMVANETTNTLSASDNDVDKPLDPIETFESSWGLDPALEESEFITITLKEHKPLGCTVEESLGGNDNRNADTDAAPHVLISRIVAGGQAQAGGLRVGDVIVGVTGLMGGGTLEDVVGLGVDHVKGLVAARPQKDTLQIIVARNSKVLEEHEAAIVELCGQEDVLDSDADQSVVDYLAEAYTDLDKTMEMEDDTTDDSADESIDMIATLNDDGDGDDDSSDETVVNEEDMLASLHNMWGDELAPTDEEDGGDSLESLLAEADTPYEEPESSKPKPWSSRSSPSGTFVRDPQTGEMRNIDADP